HPRAAPREEPPDRRIVLERTEQLDPPVADAQRRGLDTLVRHGLAMLDDGAEESLVRLDRRRQLLDRDADVMDAAHRHGARWYRRRALGYSCGSTSSSVANRTPPSRHAAR